MPNPYILHYKSRELHLTAEELALEASIEEAQATLDSTVARKSGLYAALRHDIESYNNKLLETTEKECEYEALK